MLRFSFLVKLAVPFAIVPIVVFFLIINEQFKKQQADTYRLQILSTRCALFLILYPIVMYASLIGGVIVNLILQIPMALFDGYTFYCFFTLLVINFGGPSETISYMKTKEIKCFSKLCPNDKLIYYKRITIWLYYIRVIRPVVTIIQAVLGIFAYLSDKFIIIALTAFFTAVNALTLFYALSLLLSMCKSNIVLILYIIMKCNKMQ
jgi:hypothetical protein